VANRAVVVPRRDDRALGRHLTHRHLRDPLLLGGEHGVAGGERWLETDPLDRYGPP
jgi:hypothetical protein